MSETRDIPLAFTARDLPAAETILWQGRPDWRTLAAEAFHMPGVSAYFAVLAAWRLFAAVHDGVDRLDALAYAAKLAIPAAVCLAVLALLAFLVARATSFTLTDRRLLLRFGVALPSVINIPLTQIDAVRLRRGRAGRGDIALALPDAGRLWLHQLWPYARPWRPFPAQPMLRAIPDAAEVGVKLANAVAAATGHAGQRLPVPIPAAAPHAVPAAPVADAAAPA